MDLIEHATNLRRLILKCDQPLGLALIRRASLINDLPRIEELQLQTIFLEEDTLVTLLSRLKENLKILVMERVELHRGTWPSVLGGIARTCPKLNYFHFTHPRSRRGVLPCIPTVFPLLYFAPYVLRAKGSIGFHTTKVAAQRQIVGVAYRGPWMEQILTVLSASAIEFPPPRLPSISYPQRPRDEYLNEGVLRHCLSYSYTEPGNLHCDLPVL